nr:hypothetical protein [Tanacetum cinerariifolium]
MSASKGLKSSCDGCWVAKSRITCVNTNGNTTLSEAHVVSLRITSGVRVRTVYHDLYLVGKALTERKNVGFDLARPLLYFRRRPPAKGVGLHVADSHTSNHPEDDFTQLKTIQRSYSVIRERIPFELERETFEPERGDSITTLTYELSQEELNDFLTIYPVPSEYHIILPKSNQIIFDAHPGYVGLYTHSFSLANLRLPLTESFCEVLRYSQVHISRLNPFGCDKLTTFVVMCKAYGCEPSVDLFRGFFNLCRAGKWLTFAK